jgi:hypothetical protein
MARPRKYPAANDPLLLTAALEGLELQKARIDAQIRQVRAMLGKGGGSAAAVTAPSAPAAPAKTKAKKATGKRELSPEARNRIAAAQKKRWAEFRKKKAQG